MVTLWEKSQEDGERELEDDPKRLLLREGQSKSQGDSIASGIV